MCCWPTIAMPSSGCRPAVLLADHRNAQLWLPTGGHVDQDEHPRAAAERELQEELGLPAPHPVGAPWMLTVSTTVGLTAGHTDVSLWYAVRIARDQALVVDPAEFLEVRWFAFDAIPLGRCDPNLARFLRKLSAAAAGSSHLAGPAELPG
jgi:8-oxo-dGTP diphosphatase